MLDFEKNDSQETIDISALLQELEAYINKSPKVPLTGKIMIEGEYILETLDKISAKLPNEIKQARQVLDQSDKLLESIESQGKKMLEDARAQAESIVQETEIVQMAQQEAEKIAQEATAYGEALVNKANEQAVYALSAREQLQNQY